MNRITILSLLDVLSVKFKKLFTVLYIIIDDLYKEMALCLFKNFLMQILLL